MNRANPTQTRLVREFEHDAPLLSCVIDPSGRFVFAGARDRFVQCIDLKSQQKTLLEGHDSWVSAMARSPGGSDVFTADYVGHVVRWSCAGDVPQRSWHIEAHAETIRSIAVNPSGEVVATGGRDGSIRLWSASDGQSIAELAGHPSQVYAVLFHPDGKHLVSADRAPQSPSLKQWDLETGQEVRQLDASDVSAYRRGENIEWGGVRGLAVSADGSMLACCGRHKYAGPCCVLLFDWTDGKQKHKLLSSMKGVCSSVLFHPDGFLVAAGAGVAAGELCCWHPQKPEPLTVTKTTGPCLALDLHPDAQQIAAAQSVGKRSYPENGTVGVYEIELIAKS